MRTKMYKQTLRGMALIVSLLCGSLMRADDFILASFAVSGGTGAASNANFRLNGSIGETAGTTMTGPGVVLESGFWPGVVTLLTSEATLSVTFAGGQVTISWNASDASYLLEETSSLSSVTIWKQVMGVVQNRVVITPDASLKLYRLRHL